MLLIEIGIFSYINIIEGVKEFENILISTGGLWFLGSISLLSGKINIRKSGFIFIFGANAIALFILMGSNFWLWELNESWSVKPIAQMIKASKADEIKMFGSYNRPSLNWYSEQNINSIDKLKPNGWLLINDIKKLREEIDIGKCDLKDNNKNWYLVYCDKN